MQKENKSYNSMTMTRTVVLMGLPGSGKGTQAKVLAEREGYTHFSTGDIFKELRNGDGPLSAYVKSAYDAGKLLPDWFATYLFADVLLKLPQDSGVVCDGYPRSVGQAEVFDNTMTWLSRPYKVLYLEVSKEEALRRQLSRATVENRPDSQTPEQIEARFEEYKRNTEPVLEFFREKGLLVTLDGEKTPDEVSLLIQEALK